MRTSQLAVGVAVLAVVLVVAVFLVRSNSDPIESETPPAVPKVEAILSPEPFTLVEPSAPPAAQPIKRFDSRTLLADLAHAVRSGDLSTARRLLDELRDFLLPPVLDEENAAILYAKALPLFDLPNPEGNAERAYNAIIEGKEPSSEGLALLRQWLASHAEAFAEGTRLLREGAKRPQCRFVPESEQGLGPDTSTVLQMQKACNLLSIQAFIGHLDGRSAEAGENVRAAWALARGGRTPPRIIYQMFGCALESIVFDSLLRDGIVDRLEVATFISQRDPSYGTEAWNRSLLGEVYGTSSVLLGPDGDPGQARELPVYIESIAEVLNLPASRYAEGQLQLKALARKYGKESQFDLPQGLIPMLYQVKRPMMTSEVRTAILQVAIEVERYRSRRGAYPQTLDALGVPLPVDPLTGGRFEYRLEGNQVLIQTSSDFRDRERSAWRSKP